jgi:chaperonin cofactor prefoldin
MALAQEDIEIIQSIVEKAIENTPELKNGNIRYEIDLRERTIRVEEELKHQRELMLEGFKAMDKRFEQMDKRFEQMDKRFEQVDKRFEQVDKRFEAMQLEMNKRFEQVDKRFEAMQLEIVIKSLFGGRHKINVLHEWASSYEKPV